MQEPWPEWPHWIRSGEATSVSDVTVHGSTLTSTFHHPLDDETQGAFAEAQYPHRGDLLQTPTGTAQITALRLEA